MKLYYAPGACSMADHVALREAGLDFVIEKVDLKARTTESGTDFATVNPKGYVPALALDSGETITENIAILDWVGQQSAGLVPQGALGRTRLMEMLAFISTELHKSFKPFFANGSDADKAKAAEQIGRRLGHVAERLDGDYLFGAQFSVADAYLFTMLTWVKKFDLALPKPLPAYFDRVAARRAVQDTLKAEGLD